MSTTTELEILPARILPVPALLHSVEDNPSQRNKIDRMLGSNERTNPSPSPRHDAEAIDQALPRVDGGPAAWKFLFGAFMIEAFQWGQQQPYPSNSRRGLTAALQASPSPSASSKITNPRTPPSPGTNPSRSLAPSLQESCISVLL